MAPNVPKALKAFIDDIPEAKLRGLPNSGGNIHHDDNFRLDMQGVRILVVAFSQLLMIIYACR